MPIRDYPLRDATRHFFNLLFSFHQPLLSPNHSDSSIPGFYLTRTVVSISKIYFLTIDARGFSRDMYATCVLILATSIKNDSCYYVYLAYSKEMTSPHLELNSLLKDFSLSRATEVVLCHPT